MAFYCTFCGGSLSGDAHFCSACGRSTAGQTMAGRLYRARMGRKVAGVCQGMANAYGWDVTLLRVIAVLLAVVAFPVGLIAYFIFWLVVPEEPAPLAATDVRTTQAQPPVQDSDSGRA